MLATTNHESAIQVNVLSVPGLLPLVQRLEDFCKRLQGVAATLLEVCRATPAAASAPPSGGNAIRSPAPTCRPAGSAALAGTGRDVQAEPAGTANPAGVIERL